MFCIAPLDPFLKDRLADEIMVFKYDNDGSRILGAACTVIREYRCH
ncbi:MAG: hypothetical protein KAU38_14510 [Desulfobacterales bacterium]|nr:hypothetical protein [Desulfobacterales bacterium]